MAQWAWIDESWITCWLDFEEITAGQPLWMSVDGKTVSSGGQAAPWFGFQDPGEKEFGDSFLTKVTGYQETMVTRPGACRMTFSLTLPRVRERSAEWPRFPITR